MLSEGSSGSLETGSSLTGRREAGAGEELCTTMAGVVEGSDFLIWERSEFVRERERPSSPEGGGDLKRGDIGQRGVLSPELEADVDFKGRGALAMSDEADADGTSGTLEADRARLMAAAEGVVVEGPTRLGPLLGLGSALVMRDRTPVLLFVPEVAAGRAWGRAGDASREERGDVADEEGPERF